ncbi:PAS domain-containing sensor histidine kinase [Hymenobacter psychrophilus]|uniref:histidine kinase n=1 Tax=Hymenobacter psychrophilus TaxID=651662 RepID=A0A1H3CSZ7_9BACT|nr:PAS domain-containing protein [Hymenobacter psychrophilus]SDX57291.1 Signal transduction histidine kinase [Hymenobacter psychrophilus]
MLVSPSATASGSLTDDNELAALLDVSPAAMGLLRPIGAPGGNQADFTDLSFDYLNPAAQRLIGLPARPTATWLTRLPATNWLLEICRAALQSGEPGHYELPPAGPDEPSYRLTFRPVAGGRLVIGCGVDEAGSAGSLAARLHRLTLESGELRQQLAQAETAVQNHAQERENFYQVFEQAPVIVALLRGPQHLVTYCNPAFLGLFPGRRLVGLPYAEAMPEIVAHGLMPELDAVYATGRTFYGNELPVRMAPPDGSLPQVRYYDFSYQPYRENDEIVGISIFAYDVTEQVQTRRQRDAQQQQLTEVFEQAPVAICLFRGTDYVLEIVNSLMLDILQRPLAQLLGRPFDQALPELAEQGLCEVLDEVRRSGQAYVVQERALRLPHHTGDAEMGYYNFVYEPLRDEEGQLTGIVCVATEETEQVQIRQQLSAANEQQLLANQQLTHINADLDNFIYTASHDLKAPISNIEALVTALREDLALPPFAQADVPGLLDLMQDSVERFKHTIDQLTDITKLQKAHANLLAPLRLADLVEAVRLDLAPELAATGGTLTVEVPADLTMVFAEKNLRSIVYNLLSNAFKYRHPARPLQVALRATNTSTAVVLEVRDNGLGLTPTQQPRVFDMFERLHDHVEGSGLGLYMVKKILDNAGGRVELDSESGVGSVFRVHLPV